MTTGNHLAVAALAALFLSAPAFAVLGGDAATVQADSARMKADAHRVNRDDRYTVHIITLPSGTRVREYVSPQGKVFGVAWQGPVRPDLQQLMGSYFDDYAQGVRSKRTRRQATRIEERDLVVTMGGHARALTGRAYVKSLLPQDVAPEDIQ